MSRDARKGLKKRTDRRRSVTVNFRPSKRDVPVFDQSRSAEPFSARYVEREPDELDEILGNFGDWGSQ